MGFDINEKITTELHYKDVSLISVALCIYIEDAKRLVAEGKNINIDEEVIQRANRIVNRLGNELYNCPQTEPNGH